MTEYDLWGPWTGATLRDHPPLPYRIAKRRRLVRRTFLGLLMLAVMLGAMRGLCIL